MKNQTRKTETKVSERERRIVLYRDEGGLNVRG